LLILSPLHFLTGDADGRLGYSSTESYAEQGGHLQTGCTERVILNLQAGQLFRFSQPRVKSLGTKSLRR
jgi:hypothetical protein